MNATTLTLFLLLFSSLAFSAELFLPATHPSISIVGRYQVDVNSKKSVSFDWSGIQIFFNVTGTKSVRIDLDSGGSYSLSVDGGSSSTFTPGNSSNIPATLANTLDVTRCYQFLIFKQHEPATSGIATFNGIWLEETGSLNPPRLDSTRRLEWVGGSTTCGYGIRGPYVCSGDSAMKQYESSHPTYGGLVSRLLNADYTFICSSGATLMTQSDFVLPSFYGKTLSRSPKTSEPWDFQKWVPHGIVLNIGTNDFTSKTPPAPDQFTATYSKFIVYLQKANPGVTVFNVCGPIALGTVCDSVKNAVASFNSTSVVYVDMQKILTKKDLSGCGGHPTPEGASSMASILLPIIKSTLNWN